MSKLNPEKLSVDFRKGVTHTEPIIPRRYTLTHSDITEQLFLTIGLKYAYDKINSIRDEVLGEWIKIGANYIFCIYLHVDNESGSTSTAIRNTIFRRELPLALEAIRYGDKKFFSAHPKLDNNPIVVYFNSINPYFNKIENWGTFSNYNINTSNFFLENKYLLDMKLGDVNGDTTIDKVSLYGNKPDDETGIFANNITIIIQTKKDNYSYNIPLKVNSGYNSTIFLGDFTGDKVDDILISINSEKNGGCSFFHVYSFLNNTPQKLFDFELFNDYYLYDVVYKDNYQVEVINKTLNKQFTIDIRNKGYSYLSEIYNEDGQLKAPLNGKVSALSQLYPIDFQRNGIYKLYAIQRITGKYNTDTLGFTETPLRFNGQQFAPVNLNQFVAIPGIEF